MKYGQQYFKNRKAVQMVQSMIEVNAISLANLKEIGIPKSKIDKWEKEGKIYPMLDGRKKLYSRLRIAELMNEE